MSTYTAGSPQPYGVLPTGNAIFEDKPYALRCRGLGKISRVVDEALIEIISFLAGPELSHCLSCSKALYVYCNHSDLWRDLTLRKWNGRVDFIRTWKDTYVSMRREEVLGIEKSQEAANPFIPHKPLIIRTIYSNLLHRSWMCRVCDFEYACPGFYKHEDIPRRKESELDVETFVNEFEALNKPVLISGAISHWPAADKWRSEYLSSCCGERTFRATSATAPVAANFTMQQYFDYAAQTKEEAALYLFDRDFATIPALAADFDVPKYFNPTTAKHGADLFRLLGEKQRPDYRWLIAGPARSGSIFHIDPNQTNAWNVCIRGRKKWIFYPPNQSPPGVVSSADGGDVTVPLSTGEWLLSFWPAHLEARRSPDPRLRPLECIAEEGEVIFVPNGWWHMVVNLDDCIALTQNYCSTSNLSACLRFLREKTDQISGVRDRVDEAIQPEEIYGKLLERLREELPAEVVDKAVAESLGSRAKIPKRKHAALTSCNTGGSNSRDDDHHDLSLSSKKSLVSSIYDREIKKSGTMERSTVTSVDDITESPVADEASAFSFSFF